MKPKPAPGGYDLFAGASVALPAPACAAAAPCPYCAGARIGFLAVYDLACTACQARMLALEHPKRRAGTARAVAGIRRLMA